MAKGKGKGKAKAAPQKAAPKKKGRRNIRKIRDPAGFEAVLAAAAAPPAQPAPKLGPRELLAAAGKLKAPAPVINIEAIRKRELAILKGKKNRYTKARQNCFVKCGKKCSYHWNKKVMKAHQRMSEYLSGQRTRKPRGPRRKISYAEKKARKAQNAWNKYLTGEQSFADMVKKSGQLVKTR